MRSGRALQAQGSLTYSEVRKTRRGLTLRLDSVPPAPPSFVPISSSSSINSQCLSCCRWSKFSSKRASACLSLAAFHFIKIHPCPTDLITSNAPRSPRDRFSPCFRPESLHRSSRTSPRVILFYNSRGLILSLFISAVPKTE